MSKPKIGWLGVGLMGHGAAANILAAGYDLMVKGNRNRQPVEDLVERGATEASTPAELASACDIVFTCVPSTHQVEMVVYGDDGLLAGAHKGLIHIDCTTADPHSTDVIAKAWLDRDCVMLDCPFSRTPKEAEEGRLVIMAGGMEQDVERVRPVLDTFTEEIIYCGLNGSGHRMKLLHNMAALTIIAVNAEALATGAKLGLDLKTVHKVFSTGGAANVVLERTMPWVLEGDDSVHKGTIWVGAKDLRAYMNMAGAADAPGSLCAAALQHYTAACAQGHADRFMPIMPQVVAQMFGGHIRDL